jgi:type I restriction enzyme S subunit
MSKQERKKFQPKLRFPAFNNTGDWTETDLNSVAELIDDRAADNEYTLLSITSGVGLISQKEKFGREIAGNQYKNYYVIRKWDFAYNKSATKLYPEGYISMLKDLEVAAVPNSIFTCFRINQEIVCPQFLDYLFHDNFHGKWLRKFIEVGARAHGSLNVDNSIFFSMPVVFPSLEEQKKIANCLSSIDDLIISQSQKLETLKTHKKGLMQQLFPAQGTTVSKLRFTEFKDTEKWKENQIGRLIEVYRETSTTQDEYEVLTSARNGLVKQRDYYNNDRITERDNVGFNIIPPNYITYRSRSDDRRFFFNENNLGITGIISTYYPVFRMINGSNKFLIELLIFNADFIGKNAVGTSQTVLSLNELRRIKLQIPENEEQQIIADCLSSLDELIAAQSQKIETLKAHKKGLMQQLFPTFSDKT